MGQNGESCSRVICGDNPLEFAHKYICWQKVFWTETHLGEYLGRKPAHFSKTKSNKQNLRLRKSSIPQKRHCTARYLSNFQGCIFSNKNAGAYLLIPGLGRSPGVREWPPTPAFLPGESQGQRSLAGYIQSMGPQRVKYYWATNTSPFSFPQRKG